MAENNVTHTPGPWFARDQTARNGESLGWIVEHGNGRIGWSCYATAAPNEGESAPFPIGAANAFLIAASPDLLTALQAMQAWLDAAPPLPADRALWDPLFVKAHDLMCAAIAKAEGR